jgi:hypothetical protein
VTLTFLPHLTQFRNFHAASSAPAATPA